MSFMGWPLPQKEQLRRPVYRPLGKLQLVHSGSGWKRDGQSVKMGLDENLRMFL